MSKSNEKADRTVLVSMVSGLFAGSFAKLLTHPFDTVKAKIQVSNAVVNKPTLFGTFKQTLITEGTRGLFKGLPIAVFGSMPASVLYFGSYEFAKKNLLLFKNFSNSEFLMYFLSGMFAESISCLIFVPVDIIKERRQVQTNLGHYNYKSDFDAFKTIIKQEKIRGLYKAYGATIMSFGPMSAFYFMFYEIFKGYFVRNDAKTYIQRVKKENSEGTNLNISFKQSILCAGLASSLSSFLTSPLDLVKLRMQVQRASSDYKKENAVYRNMLQGLIHVAKTEGAAGLYRGALARVVYHTPNGALSMTFLEVVKPHVRKALDKDS